MCAWTVRGSMNTNSTHTSATYVSGAHRIHLRMSLLGNVLGKVWHRCLSPRCGIYCAMMPLARKTTPCRSGGCRNSALRQLNLPALTMSDKTHQQRSLTDRGGLGVVEPESSTPDISCFPKIRYWRMLVFIAPTTARIPFTHAMYRYSYTLDRAM